MEIIEYKVRVGPAERQPHLLQETWTYAGALHRAHGPAYILYTAAGEVHTRWWYHHGQPHRDGAPAFIQSYTDDRGLHEVEAWYLGGERCRHDGPAETKRLNGLVVDELWCAQGRGIHRDGGPAALLRDLTTGQITREAWYHGGKLHRLDGPALTIRDGQTGKITEQRFCRHGRRFIPASTSEPDLKPF